MRSIFNLSFSSKTWLSMLSAITTGFAHVVSTSAIVRLLQNRYSSCAASRDAYMLPTVPPIHPSIKPGRCGCPHHSILPSEKGSTLLTCVYLRGVFALVFLTQRPDSPTENPLLYLPLLLGFPGVYCPFLASMVDRFRKEGRIFLQQLFPPFTSFPFQLL